jgi:hypothetical protein
MYIIGEGVHKLKEIALDMNQVKFNFIKDRSWINNKKR